MNAVEQVRSRARCVVVWVCLAVALPLLLMGGSCSSGKHEPAAATKAAAKGSDVAATPAPVAQATAVVQATPVLQPTPVPKATAVPRANAALSGAPPTHAAETPAGPPWDHTKARHGVMHKPGAKHPIAQGCPACHGADLAGLDGTPSCFQCHGRRWRE